MALEEFDTVAAAALTTEVEKLQAVSVEIKTPGKGKLAREKKGKNSLKEKKAKVPVNHPPYRQMIAEAISELKERSGSSQQAIGKFIEEKYKPDLPQGFKKMLSMQLKNLTNAGNLTRIKNSYKLSEGLKKASKAVKSRAAEAAPAAAKTKNRKRKVAKTAEVSQAAKAAKVSKTKSPKGGKKMATPRKVAKSIKTAKLRTPRAVSRKA